MTSQNHKNFMHQALRVAREGLGRTFPNPTVGCVIVDEKQRLLACCRTANMGRPHAEPQAIEQALKTLQARGDSHPLKSLSRATLYVTLEPCAHHGKTPPCTQAIVQSSLKRVFIATEDPDPRVSGKGIQFLQEKGVDVQVGLLKEEAQALLWGYFQRTRVGRPMVTLKTAISLDGKIALENGKSFWITGESARLAAHQLRATHDATMVGIGTVLADDPLLTVRLCGVDTFSHIRIVLDSQGRLPLDSRLVQTTDKAPVWLLTTQSAKNLTALRKRGVRVFCLPANKEGQLSLSHVLDFLGKEGISSLLVEGGCQLQMSFFQENLAQAWALFQAPCLIGEDGKGFIRPLFLNSLEQAPRLKMIKKASFEQDSFVLYTLRDTL